MFKKITTTVMSVSAIFAMTNTSLSAEETFKVLTPQMFGIHGNTKNRSVQDYDVSTHLGLPEGSVLVTFSSVDTLVKNGEIIFALEGSSDMYANWTVKTAMDAKLQLKHGKSLGKRGTDSIIASDGKEYTFDSNLDNGLRHNHQYNTNRYVVKNKTKHKIHNHVDFTWTSVEESENFNFQFRTTAPSGHRKGSRYSVGVKTAAPQPLWTITKSTTSVVQNAGDTLNYAFSLTNTGNTNINNISLEDAKCATDISYLSGDTNNNQLLDPSETYEYTCTSIPVTQAEVDSGKTISSVNAHGSSNLGTLQDVEANLEVPITTNSSIALIKKGLQMSVPGLDVRYTFRVKNTGNTTLTNISIDDPKVNVEGSIDTLLPGEEDNSTFSAIYTATSDEFGAGLVENQAVVTGTDSNNISVEDSSDDDSYTENNITKTKLIDL